MLGTEFQDMLRCIRCAACINHCPVYGAVGGHAYGWVYPGPMGAVLTPALIGIDEAGHLPNASTFCGTLRKRLPGEDPAAQDDAPLARARVRAAPGAAGATARGLGLWALVAQRPALYHGSPGSAARLLGWLGAARGRFRSLPLAGGWTAVRDMPAPEGRSFHSLWAERQRQAVSA